MKLSGREARRFCAAPDMALVGALLHGPDDGLIALCRGELVATVTEGDDLRLTRLEGDAARRDPAAIDEALRARGFFPGRRSVVIADAKDTLAKPLEAILEGVTAEEAFLVVEGGSLGARSPLRRLFEGDRRLAALGLYPQAPGAGELREGLEAAGMAQGLDDDAMAELTAAAAELDAGAVQQLIEKIAIFSLDAERALSAGEMRALLPQARDADLDRLLEAVAGGAVAEVGPLIGRLSAGGVAPVRIMIAIGGHFRRLLTVASAGGGAEQALGRLRPPVFGTRRDAMMRQVRRWGAPRLERAVRMIFEADRTLRSPGDRPDQAIVERTLIRLALMV